MSVWPAESIIAHRGSSYGAPENTLAALQLAVDEGARWIEIDVRISRDGVPLLSHDEDFKRCAGWNEQVRDLTWREIATLDVGHWFSNLYMNEPVPTLLQALKLVQPKQVGLVLDIKAVGARIRKVCVSMIAEVLKSVPIAADKIVISSIEPEMLAEFAVLGQGNNLALIYDYLPSSWYHQAEQLGVKAIHLNVDQVSQKDMVAVKERGFQLRLYTVNNPLKLKSFLPVTPDAVFTDCPLRFLSDKKEAARKARLLRTYKN